MIEPLGETLAEVRDYDQLHAALRARVDALGVTFETVDEVAGLPVRYSTKLLSPVQMKAIGKVSLGPLLGALGLKLIVAVDDEALARIAKRLVPRARSVGDAGETMPATKRKRKRSIWKGSSDWGRIMKARQLLVIPESKRKRIARTAARARWSKPRPIVVETKAKPRKRFRVRPVE